MASTNKTTHYDLSQYVGSDKPTYLGDYNTDMAKIDTAINSAKTTADTASTAATNAATAASNAQTTADTAVTNAAAAQTSANTANTNIGTLANLTTTEKTTIVGAINEVDGEIGNLSQLSTTNKSSLVSAINEVKSEADEGENYTNTEHHIGTWVNGSDIYRKCFTIQKSDFVASGNEYVANIAHGVTGLTKVINCSMIFKSNTNPVYFNMAPKGTGTAWLKDIGNISTSVIPVYLGTSSYADCQEVEVIFEYVKSN
jgi:hypothetical protein